MLEPIHKSSVATDMRAKRIDCNPTETRDHRLSAREIDYIGAQLSRAEILTNTKNIGSVSAAELSTVKQVLSVQPSSGLDHNGISDGSHCFQ